MAHLQYLDELIREYLLFRGFSGTLKAFDAELKIDKDKGFRVDKIVEQLMQYISTYDLQALRELWVHLDQRMFSKLEHHFSPAIRKLENAVLKLYLVNAITNNKQEKVTEFFTRMTPELQNQSEWKEWFIIPFIKSPEENPSFAVHFTRQWQDTLLVSLHNFLATIFQCMPLPTLASYEEDVGRMRRLQDENEALRQKVMQLSECGRSYNTESVNTVEALHPIELMDDFYIIAQESLSSGDGQAKKLKNLIRTIGSGLPTSPSLNRKSALPGAARKIIPSVSNEEQVKRHSNKQRQSSSLSSNNKSALPVEQKKRLASGDPQADRKMPAKLPTCDVVAGSGSFLLLSQEEYSEHRASICHCKFNSSGTAVASTDIDGVIKLWAATPSLKTTATFMSKSSVLSLDWVTKNERFFISGHKMGLARLYDTRNNKMIWELGSEPNSPLQDSWVIDVRCSPTESTFICSTAGNQGSGPGKLLMYDIKTRKLERSLPIDENNVVANFVTFNHNGQLLIAGCNDGSVRIYDIRRSDCIDVWPAHQGPVESIELTSDFTSCYTLGHDNKLCQRSLNQSGQVLWESTLPAQISVDDIISPHGQLFTWDPTGTFVLMCGSNGGVIFQVLDSTLSCVLDLKGHNNATLAADWAIANQCATVVTASNDGKICMSTLLTP